MKSDPVRLGLMLVVLLAPCAGCDGGLPRDMGVWWDCIGQADRDGFFLGAFPPDEVRVCANPGIPSDDVVAACRGACGDKYRAYGLFITCDIDPGSGAAGACHPSFTLDADCQVLSASPRSGADADCAHGSIIFYQGGPSQYEVTFDAAEPDASAFQLTIQGHSAAGAAHGKLEYTVSPIEGPCPPSGCAVQISFAEVFADNVSLDLGFPVGTVTVSGMVARSAELTRGTLLDDGSLVIPTGAMRVSTNFDVNGEHGSVTLANATPLMGTIDRETGAFSIVDANFTSGDAGIQFSLRGVATRVPPTAGFSSSVGSCDAGLAMVHLDAGLSTDPEGDLSAFFWTLPGGAEVAGEEVDVALPPGMHTIELHVFDQLSGYSRTAHTVSVVDAESPEVTVEQELIQSDGCAPTVVSLGAVHSADGCDGSPPVSGVVTAINGEPANIPLVDASFTFPPGTSTVTYESVDGAGNRGFATQTVVVSESSACCTAGLEPLTGTAGDDLLEGGNHGQCIIGGAGADTIDGQNSQDEVYAGAGDDVLLGSNAGDHLDGGSGDDRLEGRNGPDVLVGGPGRDHLLGGLGPDVLRLRASCDAVAGEVLDGGSGPDTLESPLTLAELESRGVTVISIETIVLTPVEPSWCP